MTPIVRLGTLTAALVLLVSCDSLAKAPGLSRAQGTLELGHQVPRVRERDAIGEIQERVQRETPRFRRLTSHFGDEIVFKDEEATGADRMMTQRLKSRLSRLNELVQDEWAGVRLRVTEAWDEDGEHGPNSAHYEGRAADLTTSDLDSSKLGRLAYLAVQAGFDWVYFESKTHVHASVRR